MNKKVWLQTIPMSLLFKCSRSLRLLTNSVRTLSFSPSLSSDNDEVRKAKKAAESELPMTTIFSKIISKEIPAHILYEDNEVLAPVYMGTCSCSH